MPKRSPAQKLTRQDIANIKRDIAQGVSQTSIAQRYGINRSTVCDIYKGRTWKDVEPAAPSNESYMYRAVREYKANHVARQWADQLQRNPDKLEALLHKTIASWPDHKVDSAYHKTVKPQED